MTFPEIFPANRSSVGPAVSISGFAGYNSGDRIKNGNGTFQWRDDFTKVAGSHTWKFGAQITRGRKNENTNVRDEGSVTFRDFATALGTVPLDGSGKATLATSALTVGVHAITAAYGGTSTIAGSTSAPLQESITSAGGCAVGASDMLCVQPGGRFEVRVVWTNQYDNNATGVGTAFALTSESGFFTFFSPLRRRISLANQR